MTGEFAKLKALLASATREHYQRYRALHPGEEYYGYSLFTDDTVSSIGPAATVGSALKPSRSNLQDAYYRYGAHEWNDFDDFGLFAEANKRLKALHGMLEYPLFRQQSLEAALQALQELEADGLFGPRSDDRFVALWVVDSNDPITDRSAKELNSPAVFAAYSSEYLRGI